MNTAEDAEDAEELKEKTHNEFRCICLHRNQRDLQKVNQ
jgi:hypothetical protein